MPKKGYTVPNKKVDEFITKLVNIQNFIKENGENALTLEEVIHLNTIEKQLAVACMAEYKAFYNAKEEQFKKQFPSEVDELKDDLIEKNYDDFANEYINASQDNPDAVLATVQANALLKTAIKYDAKKGFEKDFEKNYMKYNVGPFVNFIFEEINDDPKYVTRMIDALDFNLSKDSQKKLDKYLGEYKMGFDEFAAKMINANKLADELSDNDENYTSYGDDNDKQEVYVNKFVPKAMELYNNLDDKLKENDLMVLTSKLNEKYLEQNKTKVKKQNPETIYLNAENSAKAFLIQKYADINPTATKRTLAKDFDVFAEFLGEKLGKNELDEIAKDISVNFSTKLTNKLDSIEIKEYKQKEIKIEESEEEINTNIKIDVNDEQIKEKLEEIYIKSSKLEQKQRLKDEIKIKVDKHIIDSFTDFEIDEMKVRLDGMRRINEQNPNLQGFTDKDVRDLQNQYNRSLKMAEKIDNDQAFKVIFRDLKPGDKGFDEAVKTTIARLAKGDNVFDVQRFFKDDKTKYNPFKNDYSYCTRFMLDTMHRKFENYESTIEDLPEFVLQTEEDYGNPEITVIDLKDNANKLAKPYLDKLTRQDEYNSLFGQCEEPEEFKTQFSKLIDDYLSGKKTIPNTELKADTKGIGLIANHLTNLIDEFAGAPSTNGLNVQTIKDICDKKLDGDLVVEEFERRFNGDLAKHSAILDLNSEEKSALMYEEDDENPYRKVANNKVQGISSVARKDSQLLTDALATYARLSEIHSKRSGWYWLTSPIKNLKEYFAIKGCESVLKNEFHMSKGELELAKTMANHSVDGINQAAVVSHDKVEYEQLMNSHEKRQQDRLAALEKPVRDLKAQEQRERDEERAKEKEDHDKWLDNEKKMHLERATKKYYQIEYRNLYHDLLIAKDEKMQNFMDDLIEGKEIDEEAYNNRFVELYEKANDYVKNHQQEVQDDKKRAIQMEKWENELAETNYKHDLEKNGDAKDQIIKLNKLANKNIELQEKLNQEGKESFVINNVRRNSVGAIDIDLSKMEIDKNDQVHKEIIDNIYKGK